MEYEVKITPYALRQMQEIVRYISATLQSPENAVRWLDTIKAELASLSSMPARIPLTEEEPWHSQGIHKMVVKNFYLSGCNGKAREGQAAAETKNGMERLWSQ